MNRKFIISLSTLVALSCGSVSAFAGTFDDATAAASVARSEKNQAAFNSAVADANESKAIAAYNDTTSRNGSGRFNADGSFSQSTIDAGEKASKDADAAHAAQDKANAAAIAADAAVNGSAMKAQVNAQQAAAMQGDALTAANQSRTQQQVDAKAAAEAAQTISNYGVKGNPNLTATYSEPAKQVSYNGVSQRPATITAVSTPTDAGKPATGSINVAASSLNPSTKVTATVEGKTVQTTAGELAKVAPQIQVAIPHVDALIVSQRQGSDHSRNNSRSEHGTGNGGNNAANSNSAHGLGGGNHIGGGSAQSGSRNVGHW